jgi:hypothetical protein
VLKVDVWKKEVSTIGGPLKGGKARPSGKYKYLGGVNGRFGANDES